MNTKDWRKSRNPSVLRVILQSAPYKTDDIDCLLGWAEELQTLRKQYQEAKTRLTELQNKYRVAKKTSCRYKLLTDGKERHIPQEWQHIVVGLQKVLQAVQGKGQAALTDSALTESAVTDSALNDSALNDSAFTDSAVTDSAAG
jgi:hypothetical protein